MLCFFFNDTATSEIYTLSLHDALPIFTWQLVQEMFSPAVTIALLAALESLLAAVGADGMLGKRHRSDMELDRKSTRLNSSHAHISYAVLCLKKKLNAGNLRSRKNMQQT